MDWKLEARHLLSKREGMHDLQNAYGTIYACCELREKGKYDPELITEYAESVLAKMRIAVATGIYPGRNTEAGKRCKKAADALFGKQK